MSLSLSSPLPVRTTSQTSAASQLSISDRGPARMAKAEPWEPGSAQEPCPHSAPPFCPARLCPAISHPPFLGPHSCAGARPEPRALGAPASPGAESCSPALIWGHCLWRTDRVLLDTMPGSCPTCVKGQLGCLSSVGLQAIPSPHPPTADLNPPTPFVMKWQVLRLMMDSINSTGQGHFCLTVWSLAGGAGSRAGPGGLPRGPGSGEEGTWEPG